MTRVIEPGYVEELLRHAMGGRLVDRPGKPAIDKRDIYIRLARVERIYPYKQEALITPYKYIGERDFGGWTAKIAFSFFDDNTLLTYIPPKKDEGYDDNGYYIIPDGEVYALTVAVEGMAEEKGRYIVGFVARPDHQITTWDTLTNGVIIEFKDSQINIEDMEDHAVINLKNVYGASVQVEKDIITLTSGSNTIRISQDGIEINGSVKINGTEY